MGENVQQDAHVAAWVRWMDKMAVEYANYARTMAGDPFAARWRLIARALRLQVGVARG